MTATIILTALTSAGCAQSPSPSTQVSSPTTLPWKQIDLTCTGSSTVVQQVSIGNSRENAGTDVFVAWSGTGKIDIATSFTITATVTDPVAGITRQLGHKTFANGSPTQQYVFDMSSNQNRYVPASSQTGPASFPRGLAGMSSQWQATATAEADGKTVATCTPSTEK